MSAQELIQKFYDTQDSLMAEGRIGELHELVLSAVEAILEETKARYEDSVNLSYGALVGRSMYLGLCQYFIEVYGIRCTSENKSILGRLLYELSSKEIPRGKAYICDTPRSLHWTKVDKHIKWSLEKRIKALTNMQKRLKLFGPELLQA